VLAPHGTEHFQLDPVRLAAEELRDAREFARGQAGEIRGGRRVGLRGDLVGRLADDQG
jgi:hypothetical protein